MKIAIIGCGNMGSGLASRLFHTNTLYFFDRNIEKSIRLESEGYGKACHEIKEALQNAELIILAVKPQNLKEIAPAIVKNLNTSQILISLLAGTPLEILSQTFPNIDIVRMMPNLAITIGQGIVGLSAKDTLKIKNTLTNLFEPLGTIYWLPEDKMEALSVLAGSAPAFTFVMIEAMMDAGISMGFSVKDAQTLIYQMLKGSISLLETSKKHPGELKWQITSPAGTTITGLKKLEEQGLRGAIINTFLATYEKALQFTSNWKIK